MPGPQTKISIKNSGNILKIVVEDNGEGFNIHHEKQVVGVSIAINGINSFDGDMPIKSAPGKGCELKIKILY